MKDKSDYINGKLFSYKKHGLQWKVFLIERIDTISDIVYKESEDSRWTDESLAKIHCDLLNQSR